MVRNHFINEDVPLSMSSRYRRGEGWWIPHERPKSTWFPFSSSLQYSGSSTIGPLDPNLCVAHPKEPTGSLLKGGAPGSIAFSFPQKIVKQACVDEGREKLLLMSPGFFQNSVFLPAIYRKIPNFPAPKGFDTTESRDPTSGVFSEFRFCFCEGHHRKSIHPHESVVEAWPKFATTSTFRNRSDPAGPRLVPSEEEPYCFSESTKSQTGG